MPVLTDLTFYRMRTENTQQRQSVYHFKGDKSFEIQTERTERQEERVRRGKERHTDRHRERCEVRKIGRQSEDSVTLYLGGVCGLQWVKLHLCKCDCERAVPSK